MSLPRRAFHNHLKGHSYRAYDNHYYDSLGMVISSRLVLLDVKTKYQAKPIESGHYPKEKNPSFNSSLLDNNYPNDYYPVTLGLECPKGWPLLRSVLCEILNHPNFFSKSKSHLDILFCETTVYVVVLY